MSRLVSSIIPFLLIIALLFTAGCAQDNSTNVSGSDAEVSAADATVAEESLRDMIEYQKIAFCAGGGTLFIDVENIDRYSLQMTLFAYEDNTGVVLTIDEIMEYLCREPLYKGYSSMTYENDPKISDYVHWAADFSGQVIARKYIEYASYYFKCYKEENGIVGNTALTARDLSYEDLLQLRQKVLDPDYELTIDLSAYAEYLDG